MKSGVEDVLNETRVGRKSAAGELSRGGCTLLKSSLPGLFLILPTRMNSSHIGDTAGKIY